MKKQNVRTLSFIVSTFTYLLIGAAIFDALESQTEENIRNDLEYTELDYKAKYNISNDEYKNLEDIVIKYHPYRKFPQWKFTGAFYFSLTVITTIGYGHSTPQTIPGKTFCMFYAIIGIPLCLVMFQSVGERLNYFASFCIQLVKKCIKIKNTEVSQTEMVCVAGVFAFFVITGGAAMFSHYEGWTYFNAIYYCVITLTTIGFGDYVDRNDLTNTTYVILSFTFILFGLTVVASSINLLVLKFLTMNTDDERREEYSKKAQKPQNIRFSSTDLLNVVNGNVICTYEPSDLEELRRENSIKFCFFNRSKYNCYFNKKFPFFTKKRSHNDQINEYEHSEYNLGRLDKKECNYSKFLTGVDSYSIESINKKINNDNNSKYRKIMCSSCLDNFKTKKSHYTVRRGPGKISHLLITNRLNSLELNQQDNNERNNKQKIAESPIILAQNTNDSKSKMKKSFKKEDFYDSTNKQSNNNNFNFDVNVYIDDENEQDDYLTITNITTLTTLTNTKQNNSDCKMKINTNNISTPIEQNLNTNNLLSVNYLSASSIRKNSNNDLSSQNITDNELSYEKRKIDDESSLNDADDMVSSRKFYV